MDFFGTIKEQETEADVITKADAHFLKDYSHRAWNPKSTHNGLMKNSTINITNETFFNFTGGPHYPPGGVCGENLWVLVARRHECTPGMGRGRRTHQHIKPQVRYPCRRLWKVSLFTCHCNVRGFGGKIKIKMGPCEPKLIWQYK